MKTVVGHLLLSAASSDVVWMATVLVLILAGLMSAYIAVKLFFNMKREKIDPMGPVFRLESLRRMHESGQLSDEEYKILKDKIISTDSTEKDRV